MDIKKFYELTGSDYHAAISIMMNDALIERMINKFMENNSYQAIINAYQAKNIKEVFALAHSFKGVTGNLALTKLFQVSSELTEATRGKEEANVDGLIEQLKKEYLLISETYKELTK